MSLEPCPSLECDNCPSLLSTLKDTPNIPEQMAPSNNCNEISDIIETGTLSNNDNQDESNIYMSMRKLSINNEALRNTDNDNMDAYIYLTIGHSDCTDDETISNSILHMKYQHIFSKDYDTPEFNIRSKSVKSDFNGFPKRKRSTSMDPMISFAIDIREEISNPGGVEVKILKYRINQFDVKQFENGLWIYEITDWKNIHRKLHVGDRIIAVNDIMVNDLRKYKSMMKDGEDHSFTIQRLPKAKAFVFDRTKSSIQVIKIKGKKVYLVDSKDSKALTWQITELNGENTFHLTNNNEVAKIQSQIDFYNQYLMIILQPKIFLNSLKGPKRRRFSINILRNSSEIV